MHLPRRATADCTVSTCCMPRQPPNNAASATRAQAEEERAAAAAKKDFFTRALADMRLVQSKVQRAVVEAQQR